MGDSDRVRLPNIEPLGEPPAEPLGEPFAVPIFTVGYGRRAVADFFADIARHGIEYFIDVRTSPFSRHRVEFRKRELAALVARHGMRYVFMGDALGGKPDDPACRDANGHIDYDRCRVRAEYLAGVERLETAVRKRLRVVLMCAEEQPTECHRANLIAPDLVARGIEVQHILPGGECVSHADLFRPPPPIQRELF